MGADKADYFALSHNKLGGINVSYLSTVRRIKTRCQQHSKPLLHLVEKLVAWEWRHLFAVLLICLHIYCLGLLARLQLLNLQEPYIQSTLSTRHVGLF